MSQVKVMSETLQIPSRLLRRWVEVCAEFEELQDELEDFLISRNPKLLRKLRKSRREDLRGKTRPYGELAQELGLSPSSSSSR